MNSNQDKMKNRQGWITWSIMSAFLFYQFILRVFPSVLANEIQVKFCVECSQYGNFSGIYYISYALMHLPIGILLDKFGTKRVVSFSILICAASIIPIAFCQSWYLCLICRILLGGASASAILGLFKIIRLYFPAKRFGFMLGLSAGIGFIGAFYGGVAVVWAKQYLTWENIILLLTLSGIVLFLISGICIPAFKTDHKNKQNLWQEILAKSRLILKTPYIISTAFLSALMVGPLEGFADIWGTPFLNHVYGLNLQVASSISGMIFLGMGAGSFVLAYIAEKFNSYRTLLQICALGMAMMFLMIIVVNLTISWLYILFAIIGILSGYQVLSIHLNSLRVAEKYVGLTSAFTNMIILSFGYVFHSIFGNVIDYYDKNVADNKGYYSVIWVLVIFLMIAFIGFIIEGIHKRLNQKNAKKP